MTAKTENEKWSQWADEQVEKLDRIVSRQLPGGNAAFQILPEDFTTDRDKGTRRAADRRDRNARDASKRERIERQKELGNDAPMTVDEFNEAIDFVRDEFGINLHSNHGGYSVRPKVSQRELFALAAAVGEGVSHRDRVLAVRRLCRIGFRVQFVGHDPRLG